MNMTPLKSKTTDYTKSNKNENFVDTVKLFIQKTRTELHELTTKKGRQRRFDKNLSATSKQMKEETKLITELPASFATQNTLRLNPSEIEQLLGIPYPGHVNSFDELQIKYTPQQRKQIYDHVVATIPTPEHLRFEALHNEGDNGKMSLSSSNISKSSKQNYESNCKSYNQELRCVIKSQMQALDNTTKVIPDNSHKKSKTKNVAVEDSVTAVNQEANQIHHAHDRGSNYKSTYKMHQHMSSSRQIYEDESTSSNRKQHRNTSPSRQYKNTSSRRHQDPYSKCKRENKDPSQYTNRHHQRWRHNNDYRVGHKKYSSSDYKATQVPTIQHLKSNVASRSILKMET